MKKLIYIIISFILTSCELEMTDNGALDGNWQLRQIDTLSTGGTCDMSRSYIYWAVQNHILQVRDIDNNNLIISTILKEFGYGTEDISDNLITAITEAMEENVHKYITVANKIELTSTLKEMSDKQREEYEEKVKRILHANRIRIEENDIFTHYFSTNAYYDREKMRDVIRDALAKYRADVHVDETPIKQESVVKEEPKKEETVKVEEKKPEDVSEKKVVVTPNDIKMKFENANALGDPVMTTMSAVEDVGVQKKVKIDNKTSNTKPKVTAEDEF